MIIKIKIIMMGTEGETGTGTGIFYICPPHTQRVGGPKVIRMFTITEILLSLKITEILPTTKISEILLSVKITEFRMPQHRLTKMPHGICKYSLGEIY